jgi:hypothetical protein
MQLRYGHRCPYRNCKVLGFTAGDIGDGVDRHVVCLLQPVQLLFAQQVADARLERSILARLKVLTKRVRESNHSAHVLLLLLHL